MALFNETSPDRLFPQRPATGYEPEPSGRPVFYLPDGRRLVWHKEPLGFRVRDERKGLLDDPTR